MTTLVDLPKKRITYKKNKNGTTYVYYTLRSYRNEKGKPTSDEKSIGKLDPETGKLIPNRNYFELFPSAKPEVKRSIHSAGLINVYQHLAKELGLQHLLDKHFPKDGVHLLNLAGYMLEMGNVMMDFDYWVDKSTLDAQMSLSSQRISELFSRITHEARLSFLDEWCHTAKEDEYIAYDVTSISSYSEQINELSMGYNRDGDLLPQVNLGVYYGEESKRPLYYAMYDGSIIDKSYLPFMIELTKELQFKQVRFVMDQGFFSLHNLQLLSQHEIKALTLLPKNYKLHKAILNKERETPFSSKEYAHELGLYYRETVQKLDEAEVKVFLYYDKQKAYLEEIGLYRSLDIKEQNLGVLAKRKKLSKTQTKYFKVEETGQKEIQFSLDYDQIDLARQDLGHFMLVTTDMSLDGAAALEIYRRKDIIEKNFDHFKNGLDFKRLHTQTSATTDGKLFVGFISLILRNEFMARLKAEEATKQMRVNQAIKELSGIQVLRENDSEIMLTLTKNQKAILKAMGIE